MKKINKIIVSIIIAFLITGCSSEGNLILDILLKEYELVINSVRKAEEDFVYVYSTLEECKEKKGYIAEDYTVWENNSLLNCIIYADTNDRVFLEIFDGSVKKQYQDIFLIFSANTDGEEIKSFIKDYGNLVNEVIFGSDNAELLIDFDMSNYFANMTALESATIINCITTDYYPKMEYIFKNDTALQLVTFNNCDLTGIRSMNGAFKKCHELLECDFLTSALNENMTVYNFLEDINSPKCCIYTKSENMYNLNLPYASYGRKSGLHNNTIYEYENDLSIYNDIVNNPDGIKYNNIVISDVSFDNLCWVVYMDSQKTVRLDIYTFDTSITSEIYGPVCLIEMGYYNMDDVKQEWKKYKNLITEINVNSFVYLPMNQLLYCSMNGWFKGMSNLKTVNINGISDNESMISLFEDCTSLKYVYFLNEDIGNVSDISKMFKNCNSLLFADIECFDGCESLCFENIFDGCNAYSKIATDRNDINSEVKQIISPEIILKTDVATKYGYDLVFDCAENIEYMDFPSYDQGWYETALPRKKDIVWHVVDVGGEIYLHINHYGCMFTERDNPRLIDYGWCNFDDVLQEWKKYGNIVTRIEINILEGDIDTTLPLDYWFSDMTAVRYARIRIIDKGVITSVKQMFENCPSLQFVDFLECDLSEMTQVDDAFKSCRELSTVIFSECLMPDDINLMEMFDENRKMYNEIEGDKIFYTR